MSVKILNYRQQVAVIKALKTHTQKEVAAKFGVSVDTIARVKKDNLKSFNLAPAPVTTVNLVAEGPQNTYDTLVRLMPHGSVDINFDDAGISDVLELLDGLEPYVASLKSGAEKACGVTLINKCNLFKATLAKAVAPAAAKEAAPAKKKAEVKPKLIWTANSKFISITSGRETFNADSTHAKFREALQALVEDRVEDALNLINVKKAIEKFTQGHVRIEGGSVFYRDIEITGTITDRIVDAFNKGEDFQPLLKFFENLMLNPSRKAVYRLFDFLAANDIKLTEDGHFIAWKKVRGDYKDIYTGTFDNSPGKLVKVERFEVEEDDEKTCAKGLHVCSKTYLGHYSGSSKDIVLAVKVNPAMVVAIPKDYNNAKMRVCEYLVLGHACPKEISIK